MARLFPSDLTFPERFIAGFGLRNRGCVLFLLLAVFAGCVPESASTVDMVPPALFASAEEAYLLGQLNEARDAFRRFAESAPQSPFQPWALYWVGRIDLKAEHFSRAVWNFKRALGLRPEPVLRAQIFMAMATVEYNRRQYHEVLRWLRRIDHEGLSASVQQDELFFKMGMALVKTNNPREADRYFAKVEQFPGSPYLEEARRRRAQQGVLTRPGSYVLVGTFPYFAPAETLANSLREDGFGAAVDRIETSGGDRFEVRIPFASPPAGSLDDLEARGLLRDLEARGLRPKIIP